MSIRDKNTTLERPPWYNSGWGITDKAISTGTKDFWLIQGLRGNNVPAMKMLVGLMTVLETLSENPPVRPDDNSIKIEYNEGAGEQLKLWAKSLFSKDILVKKGNKNQSGLNGRRIVCDIGTAMKAACHENQIKRYILMGGLLIYSRNKKSR